MIKRLFCKHKYELYHRSKHTEFLIIGTFDRWHFICKECGKRSMIDELDLESLWKSICEKVNREKAMGLDNGEYDDFEFVIGCSKYTGKGAYYLKKKFKNYHQEKQYR